MDSNLTDSELQRAPTTHLRNQKEEDIATVNTAFDMFTKEQRDIADKVIAACRSGKQALFNIHGRARSGKTVILNAINAHGRLGGFRTAASASTGFLAELNLKFGLTYHRTWGIPVPDPREDCVAIGPCHK